MFQNFKIIKQPSIYSNKTVLNEYIEENRLESLIQNEIGIEFNSSHYQRQHGFTSERDQYNKFLQFCYNKKEHCFKIKLCNSSHSWGRIKAFMHLTLSVMHRPTRHALCEGIYKDVDITSCCQTIFMNIVKSNNMSHDYPRLFEYVSNRNNLLSIYQEKYNMSRDKIKNLFTGIGFGGSANTWFEENNIENDNDIFITELNKEYYKLADIIYEDNRNICEDILKAEPNRFIKYTTPETLLSKKKRTTMAMVYQTAERYCQESCIDYLCSNKGFNIKDIVPCQDGFMILKNLYYDNICNDCSMIIKQKFNIDLEFVIKPFDEKIYIPPYITDKQKQQELKQHQKEKRELEKSQKQEELKLKKDKIELDRLTKQEELKLKKDFKEIDKHNKQQEKENARNMIHQIKEDKKKEAEEEEEELNFTILQNQINVCDGDDEYIILPSGIKYKRDVTDGKTLWLFEGCLTDKDAAEKLYNLYPHWITSIGELYVFDYTTGLYSNDTIVFNKIITIHCRFLHIMLKDDTHNKDWYRSDVRSYGNTSNLFDKVITILKTLNINNDWLKKSQSSSLGKILFENGFYDFNEQKFYDKFNSDYVFFGKIHHKFTEFDEDDLEYMQSIIQRIFYDTLGKEAGDFFILSLARGLSGECMKRILFAIGDTNCGKGVITTATALSIGDLFGSFNAESLAHRESSQDEAQIMRWVLLLRFKRIIISNEMKSGMTLNGNFIKKIASGGDLLIGRTHCKEETEFITHFLAIVLDNDMNPITPYDDAVDNRVKCLTFTKSFVDREPQNELELRMDLNIKEELKTLRFQKCFVGILIKAHMEFMGNNKVQFEPDCVKNSKKNLIESTTDKNPLNILLRDYEITNILTDFVKSKDLQDWINEKKLGISITKLGRELNKYATINKLENLHNLDKKIAGKTNKVWIGIKEREEDCDEE